MKTYEMTQAVSEQSIKKFFGAIVVEYLTFATGKDIIEDAREIGLGGFHLVCRSSHLFQLLTEMLDAGAAVLGTGWVDKTVFGDEYEMVQTLKIGVDPAQPQHVELEVER